MLRRGPPLRLHGPSDRIVPDQSSRRRPAKPVRKPTRPTPQNERSYRRPALSLRTITEGLNARGINDRAGYWSLICDTGVTHIGTALGASPRLALGDCAANGARDTVKTRVDGIGDRPTPMTQDLLILRCDIDYRRAYLFEPLRFCEWPVGYDIPTGGTVLVMDRLQLRVHVRRAVDRATLRVLPS